MARSTELLRGLPDLLPQPRALHAVHGPRDRPAEGRDRRLRPGRLERHDRRRALVRVRLLRPSRPSAGAGIGRRLLAWTEARRLELAAADELAGAARDRPRRFMSFNNDGGVGGDVLLRAAGYEPFRRFYSMRRPDLDGHRRPPAARGTGAPADPERPRRDPGGRPRGQRGLRRPLRLGRRRGRRVRPVRRGPGDRHVAVGRRVRRRTRSRAPSSTGSTRTTTASRSAGSTRCSPAGRGASAAWPGR